MIKLKSKTGGITNDMLSGSISNDKLTNSSLTITSGSGLTGGGSVELGSSSSLSVDVDNSSLEIDSTTQKVKVKNGGITNDMLAGSIDLSSKITGTLGISSLPTKNENDMTSNSSTHVPTQSSVKSYVDSEIADLVSSSSETLSTLNAISFLLNENSGTLDALNTNIGSKLSKDNNLSDLTNASTAKDKPRSRCCGNR